MTYLTAQFIDHEVAHLERMVRSSHWHHSKAWTVAYWERRIEGLKRAPRVSEMQRARLNALLLELGDIALALDKALT
jgi:hypothetical protein